MGASVSNPILNPFHPLNPMSGPLSGHYGSCSKEKCFPYYPERFEAKYRQSLRGDNIVDLTFPIVKRELAGKCLNDYELERASQEIHQLAMAQCHRPKTKEEAHKCKSLQWISWREIHRALEVCSY